MAEMTDAQVALQAAVKTAGEHPSVRIVLSEADAYLKWLTDNSE